jgi:hypothetical protein
MRAIINLVSVFFLLQGGGQYLHANAHKAPITSAHNLEKKHRVRLSNQDSGNSIIEEADLDIDEEFHSGDDLHDGNSTKFLTAKQSLLDNWYLAFSHQFILDDYSKRIKIFAPFSGDSNPIYIRQQVLRI